MLICFRTTDQASQVHISCTESQSRASPGTEVSVVDWHAVLGNEYWCCFVFSDRGVSHGISIDSQAGVGCMVLFALLSCMGA